MRKRMIAVVWMAVVCCMAVACAAPADVPAAETQEQAEPTATPTRTPVVEQEEEEKKPEEPGDVVIGLLVGDAQDAYAGGCVEGVAGVCEETGAQYVVADAQGSAEKQAMDVIDMMAMEANVIVIVPVNAEALDAACAQAREAEIPIVAIGGGADADVAVDTGEEAMLYEAGLALVEALEGKGQMALLADDAAQVDGMEALRDAAKETEIEIVGQGTGETLADAANEATTLLLAYPRLKSIWAANATLLHGAVAAAQAASREGMVMGGVGCDDAIIRMMKEEQVQVIAVQFPQACGRAAAEAAIGLALEGAYDAAATADTPYKVYTADQYALAAREALGVELPEEDAEQEEADAEAE